MVQNTAARVLCWICKYHHVTPAVKSFQWLPIEFHTMRNVRLLTLKSIRGHGLEYICRKC